MADRITRKQLKHDEFVEAAFDFEQWLEANWRPVALGVGALVGVILLAYGWSVWSRKGEERSAQQLGELLQRVEGDPANPTAPKVDWAGALPELEQLAKSGAPAGRTAEFYRGAALVNAGRVSEAIPILEAVANGGDAVLADLGRAKLAWALLAAGQAERAAEEWKRLAADEDAAVPPDLALLNAAEALAAAGRTDEAKTTLQDLLARYPDAAAGNDARALQTALGGSAAAGAGQPGTTP